MTKEDTQEQARKYALNNLTDEQRSNPNFMKAFEAGLGQSIKKDTQELMPDEVFVHLAPLSDGGELLTFDMEKGKRYVNWDLIREEIPSKDELVHKAVKTNPRKAERWEVMDKMPDRMYICDGCYTADDKIKFIPSKYRPNAISCCPERRMNEYIRKPEPIEGLGEAISHYDWMDESSREHHKVLYRAAKAYHALTGGSDEKS